MKKYLINDITATLLLLSFVFLGGYFFLDYKTEEMKQAIASQPIEEVQASLNTECEKTIFEREMKKTEIEE
jgi:hypothetical protein